MTQPEMVTREYCDNCGKDLTRETRYGIGNIIIGNCCRHIWRRQDRLKYIQELLNVIKQQPFF